LKVFRRLQEGVSPELEVNRFLNTRVPGLTPGIAGTIQLRRGRAEPSTLAVLQTYVANEGTGWNHAREELGRYFERVLTRHRDTPPEPPLRSPLNVATSELPAVAHEVVGPYLDSAVLLGRRTAELHLALASQRDDAAFAPEPYSTLDRRSKYQSMRNLVGKTVRLLRANIGRLPPEALADGKRLADGEARALKVFDPLLTQRLNAVRIRIHGDYHLEQVLYTGKDFVIIDFDGLASETLAERRRKHSAFRDVAGMIRSFHFAAFTGLHDSASVRQEDRAAAAPWAEAWHRWISGTFLRAYLATAAGAPFIPGPEELPLVLETHILEKAFFELRDELVSPTENTAIPLAAIVDLAQL
jgi:maltose alpha-D-glucosyltransferase / alpha-amylase